MFNGFAFAGPLCDAIKVNLTGAGLGRRRARCRWGQPGLRRRQARFWGRRRGWGRSAAIFSAPPSVRSCRAGVSLTAVIWVTQALRDIDLMTNQGQTILVFVGITGLIIPLLVLVIAPIALVIAAAHMLNKLSTDSEIIVMNSAGMSPWLLFRGLHVGGDRGVAAGDGDQRLFRAQGPAHAARLADRSARQRGQQHRAARPLHHDRERRHASTSASAQPQRATGRHFPRRPAQSRTSASPCSPSAAR